MQASIFGRCHAMKRFLRCNSGVGQKPTTKLCQVNCFGIQIETLERYDSEVWEGQNFYSLIDSKNYATQGRWNQ